MPDIIIWEEQDFGPKDLPIITLHRIFQGFSVCVFLKQLLFAKCILFLQKLIKSKFLKLLKQEVAGFVQVQAYDILLPMQPQG